MKNKKFINIYGLELIFQYPILCAILFFLVYWGLPFIALFDYNIVNDKIIYEKETIQYLADKTHLIFALAVSLGGCFTAWMCKIINNDNDKVHCKSLYSKDCNQKILHFTKIANSHILKVLALVIAVITAFMVSHLMIKIDTWWGVTDSLFNISGIFFIINTSIMVYLGLTVFVQISLRSFLTLRLATKFININFFHEDGCNGQKNIGNLIMLGWLVSIFCVLSIFILYYQGYHGIENSGVSAIIALILVFSIPLISIIPLFSIVKAVNKEKMKLISTINTKSRINEKITKASIKQSSLNLGVKKKASIEIDEYFTIRNFVENANIWPFNFKALFFTITAYIIESLLVLDQLFSVFKNS